MQSRDSTNTSGQSRDKAWPCRALQGLGSSTTVCVHVCIQNTKKIQIQKCNMHKLHTIRPEPLVIICVITGHIVNICTQEFMVSPTDTLQTIFSSFSFFFLQLCLQHMDVASPEVKLELKRPVYTTTTATRDLSRICNLCCSLGNTRSSAH